MSHPLGSRSMVHYDATYIIAQVAGALPRWQAATSLQRRVLRCNTV